MENIIIKVAKNDSDFVGIRSKTNNIYITFPIGYNIKEETISKESDEKIRMVYPDIKILMKIMDSNKIDYYEKGKERFSFSSAIYIIEDYLKYGLYNKDGMTLQMNGPGKIDWKETLNSIEPIYYNNSLIYERTYTNNKSSKESIITSIQKYCLKISVKVIGWLYNINKLDLIEQNNLEEKELLFELNKELHNVNEDRKKKLLREMIIFISGTSESKNIKNQEFSIGRNHFDKVWEQILRKQIYNFYEEYPCYPRTYYQYNDGTKKYNSKLIPDIIIKKENKIIIVDAKYYKENTTPDSSDIFKQILYGQYIKNKNKKCNIKNIFILPKNIEKDKFEHIAFANADHFKENKKIDVYYLDTKTVLKSNNFIKTFTKNLIEL